MNRKKIFGGLLAVIGISGIIYSSVLFASNASSIGDIKAAIFYIIISLIFFIAGVSLIRTIKDELYIE